MKILRRVLLLLLTVSLPALASTEPQHMKEDKQHITSWNGFFDSLVKIHKWYQQNHSLKQSVVTGGYATHPDFYQEVSYVDTDSKRLMTRVRVAKDRPEQIHSIDVFVYDDKGRVSRDYSAVYLPDFRNAPIQTLINIHHYNDELHAFRQFDASGDQIYEQCRGRYLNEEVFLSIDEDDFYLYRDETGKDYETYLACFEMIPNKAGAYLKPYQAELKQHSWQQTHDEMGQAESEGIDKHIQALSKQLIKEPDNIRLLLARGDAWFKLHDFDKAVADFDQALTIDSNSSPAWFGRGMAYGRMGEIDKGIADLGEFIQRNPHSSLGYTKRGVRYLWKGDRDNAERDLRKAIELDANNAEAHDDLGVIYAQKGELKDAITHFSKTIAVDPTYQKGHHNLAMAYHLSGDHDRALVMIDKALAIKADEKVSLLLKSQILAAQGKHQQATRLLDEAEYLPDGNWSELAPGQ